MKAAAEMALVRPLTLHTHGALFFQLSDSAAALVDERSLTQKSMQIIPEHIAPVYAHGFPHQNDQTLRSILTAPGRMCRLLPFPVIPVISL